MSDNHPKSETLDFNKARILSTFKDINRQIFDSDDVVSRLTRKLQTSLQPEEIIRTFTSEVAKLVNFDQFEFESKVSGIIKTDKKRAIHSCLYNLCLDDFDIGSIRFSRNKRFIEEELAIIERVASTLVFPLRNAIMYQTALNCALNDELTGCGNKRALDASLHREADLSVRHKSPLSVIMLDIDFFKKVNDTYGHSAGDNVLQQVASLIRQAARQSDLCFRYGGEEFVVLLDNTNTQHAINIAERLRQRIESHSFESHDQKIPITISLGTATFDRQETLQELMERADGALYAAKNNGRNQVCSAEHPVRGNINESALDSIDKLNAVQL